jgi:U1 small nuclear ribonucleoprotein
LFIGRLSYETTEKKLRREFEQYGPIKSVKLVVDLEDKSRGYAFIEFEREEDMTVAYKRSDSKKVDGRRILVDVERGR